jgi:hypothetical protein
MRLCLPARMGGGGKAESLPWRGPAGEARHTGVTILLWEMRGQSPWRSHAIEGTKAISLPQPQRGTNKGTLVRCDASRTPCARACGLAGVRPVERRECQRVSTKRRTLRSAQRGTECDPTPSRSSSHAPDRHPDGPGLQARSAPADRAGCPRGSGEIDSTSNKRLP